MQFTASFKLYIDIYNKHENLLCILLESETRLRINEVHYNRSTYLFICLFTFNYRALFLCLKDRTCLRIAILAYYFKICLQYLVY